MLDMAYVYEKEYIPNKIYWDKAHLSFALMSLGDGSYVVGKGTGLPARHSSKVWKADEEVEPVRARFLDGANRLKSTIRFASFADLQRFFWGSILFVLSIVLLVAGIRYSINRKQALELGTYLNAVVKMRQEDTDKPEVSLMISYQLDDKTYTDMLFDRFDSKCPYHRGDTIRVCVYNGRVFYVEEGSNEA